MKEFHTCDKMPGEDAVEEAVYYGSVFDADPLAAPEWYIDLGMEWCRINYCPWCGVRLMIPRKHQHKLELIAAVPLWLYPAWKVLHFFSDWLKYGLAIAVDNYHPEKI